MFLRALWSFFVLLSVLVLFRCSSFIPALISDKSRELAQTRDDDQRYKSIKELFENGEYEGLSTFIENYLDEYPQSIYKAELIYLQGEGSAELFRGILLLRRVTLEWPDTIWGERARYSISTRYLLYGYYVQASLEFQAFLNRYPDSDLATNATYFLGLCYISRGLYKEANNLLDEAIKIKKGDQSLINRIKLSYGDSFYLMGYYSKAMAIYQRILDYGGEGLIPALKFRIGKIQWHRGMEDKARGIYRNLIIDYPNSFEAEEARGRLAIDN